MFVRFSLLVVLVLGSTFAAFAQDEPANANTDEKHPIDAAMEKCLANNHGTMPRAECYSKASETWQTEVKTKYAELLKALPAASRSVLKQSQTRWKIYQKGEADLIMKIYGKKKGSGYISVRIILLMKAYRNRALELESHLGSVKPKTDQN